VPWRRIGEVEVKLHSSLTLALDGGGGEISVRVLTWLLLYARQMGFQAQQLLLSSLYRDCLSSEVRWPEREDDHLCPARFGINSVSGYTNSAHMPLWSDTWVSRGTNFLLIFNPSQSKSLSWILTVCYKLIFQNISKCQISKLATIWQQLT